MKKWSILSSLIVVCALAIAAFATTGAASAAKPYEPEYCPTGYEGVPPYCTPVKPPPKEEGGGTPPPKEEPPKTCATGQVGTYPNCVTPVIDVNEIKVKPNSTTVTLDVNAPGKVKVSGKGIATTTVSVSPGIVKIKLKLTAKEKKLLKEKGKLKLRVTVTYTPTGGSPVTKTIKVSIKSPSVKKAHEGHHK